MSTPPDLLDDLNIPCEFDVPLGPLTWYGVGGSAAIFARPSSIAQLSALLARCRERGVPAYCLGSGANLLVTDEGVDGVVVKLDDPTFATLTIEDHMVTVGAGFDLMKLVLATAKAGLRGLEVVAGIPASVGGAVRMNAGGAFGDTGSCVQRVQVMSDAGQVYYRDRDDLVFDYRHSNIVAPFILEVSFELTPDDPDDLMRRVKEIFLYKKNSQPMGESSAGCAFKNPTPPDPEEGGSPIAAGQLIDRAGLKGFTIGGASVSPVHANFIVADKATATANDVKAVIDHVQATVRERFGMTLEREVVVWP